VKGELDRFMTGSKAFLRISVLLFVATGLRPPTLDAQQAGQMQVRKALINQDIVQMMKAKFTDSAIIKLIKANETAFDLSADAMIELKKSGVSQNVIEAMLSTNIKPSQNTGFTVSPHQPAPSQSPAPVAPVALPNTNPEVPDEIGVYYFQKDKLISIDPEIVNWKTGGVVKEYATLGWDKGHVNGTIREPHSKLDLTYGAGSSMRMMGVGGTLEFYLRTRDGDSASEYQLLKFWEKSDRREFRTFTGGVFHASGGAQDNVLEFKFEKIAPRTFRVNLSNLNPGDYGFLPPGSFASSSAASQGKIYTFRIVE
jgi:hypothetical protein